CRPLALGGLGIRDLHRTGVALRTRWLWLQRTDPDRSWKHLHLPTDHEASVLFRASTTWTIGNGNTCKFWQDHWLNGRSIPEIAPTLSA
uniref:Reverse transcriptase zinc-binding domain-containing protein n=1 Tax=Aegilops tauschii subsp. strangulata TaxID=200361 RepID=A0A453I9A2_AEGTS